MNVLFSLTTQAIKKVFGFTPKLAGSQGDAISTITGHFVAIGEILAKGNVTAEMGDTALRSLYHSQLVVNNAVQYGWDGGRGATY